MPNRLVKPTFLITFLALAMLSFAPAPAAARESAKRLDRAQQDRVRPRLSRTSDSGVREFVRDHWMISIRLARLLGFANIPDPGTLESPNHGRVVDGPDPIGSVGEGSGDSSGDRGDSGSADESTGVGQGDGTGGDDSGGSGKED